MDETKTINGSFGSVTLNGNALTNFNHCEIKDEYEFTELKLAGGRRTKHKLVGQKGSGTISGYKVTSELQQTLINDPTTQFQLISKLNDSEAYGTERIRISKVKFTSNPLAKWKVGELVEEEWPFVFDGDPEFVDPITQ
jgi:hypothetical protein